MSRTTWSTKETRFLPFLQEAGPGHRLFPALMNTLSGSHPDCCRLVLGLIGAIALPPMVAFEMERDIPFRSHAPLLVMNNAACLLPGYVKLGNMKTSI